MPVKCAQKDAADATGIGEPIDLFFIEPLAPEVAAEDNGHWKDGEDHGVLKGGGDLRRPDHEEGADAIGNAT